MLFMTIALNIWIEQIVQIVG